MLLRRYHDKKTDIDNVDNKVEKENKPRAAAPKKKVDATNVETK